MLVSVYIRKADEDKWRELPNKTEAISKLLNGQELSGVVFKESFAPKPRVETVLKKIPTLTTADKIVLKGVGYGVCKIHGTPLTPSKKCLQKGCKNG